MSGPGKGRYTDYVSTQSSKITRLHKLFNANPASVVNTPDSNTSKGMLYGGNLGFSQSNNFEAAKHVVNNYNENIVDDNVVIGTNQKTGTPIYFLGNSNTPVPDTTELSNNIKSPPCNSYMPDLTSPGAASDGKVNFIKLEFTPIKPQDYKPFINISPSSLDDLGNLGTVSPHVSSPLLGLSSVGTNIVMGMSKKSISS